MDLNIQDFQVFKLLLFVFLLLISNPDNVARGYDAFTEGVYNLEYRPGGPNDPVGQPNLPFATDTNRYSDGFNSDSFFDITSPHFSEYRGSLSIVSDRYLHYLAYKNSAEEQGVALVGEGDARREDARYKITRQKDYEKFPNPKISFPVYAAIKWNPSDFAIQEGEFYNISVLGSQYWFDGGLRVNAAGYESYFDATSNCYVAFGRCRSHLRKKRRISNANWMSLACGIGNFVRPLVEAKPGDEQNYRWLPLDESELQETVFNVGQSVTFRAVYSGQLICFANDAQTLYWNNAGYLNVTVTRVSWPPSNTTVYQDLYLPACDSAQVVYINHGVNEGPGKVPCNPNGGGSGWKLANIL